jgi:hypothetical protein
MKVKCLNNGGSPRLIVGKIYEVYEEATYSYKLRDEWFDTMGLGGWNKDRFQIVEDSPIAVAAASTARQEKPCQVCSKMNDVGVSICWMCGNQPF